MSRNQESNVESDDDDEEEYSQDFEDDLNDDDLLSVESSSSRDILSPPPIQRISDKFEAVGLIQGAESGCIRFEIPNVEEGRKEEKAQEDYQEKIEAEQFKSEFESFRSKAKRNEDIKQNQNEEIENAITRENHKQDIIVEDQTIRQEPTAKEGSVKSVKCLHKIKFVVHHDEQNDKQRRKPAPLKKRIGYSKSRIEYLSRPRRKQLAEPMNVPTRVSTKTSWKEFIERQEYMESRRRMKQDQKRKERDYQDKIDKLKCPVCSTEQTFQEYIEFRSTCKCGAEYKKSAFHLRQFEMRMFKSRIRKQNQIQKVLDEREKALENGKYNKTDKVRTAAKASGDYFLDRMKRDLLKRNTTIKEQIGKVNQKERKSKA